jgi:hypothetical protein
MTFRELVHAMDAVRAQTATQAGVQAERRHGAWNRLAESNRGQPRYE